MKKNLSTSKAKQFAKVVLGTAKGLTKEEGTVMNVYTLQTGKINYQISIEFSGNYAEGDIALIMVIGGEGMGIRYFNSDTFELDDMANENYRKKVRKEAREDYCSCCNLYLDYLDRQEAERRRKKTDWKQGILTYDFSQGRFDISFDKGGNMGGLHCGTCFDIKQNGQWTPTRIESGSDGWYLVDMPADALKTGVQVRI